MKERGSILNILQNQNSAQWVIDSVLANFDNAIAQENKKYWDLRNKVSGIVTRLKRHQQTEEAAA